MNKDKYTNTLRQFEMYYPNLHEKAVDWKPSGRTSVIVKILDGCMYEYDSMDNSIRQIRTNTYPIEDDILTRKEFGMNLQKMIPLSGLNKSELAEKVGITNAMLSRYIRGNSTPNVVTARKLANALGCTIDELFDDDSM